MIYMCSIELTVQSGFEDYGVNATGVLSHQIVY